MRRAHYSTVFPLLVCEATTGPNTWFHFPLSSNLNPLALPCVPWMLTCLPVPRRRLTSCPSIKGWTEVSTETQLPNASMTASQLVHRKETLPRGVRGVRVFVCFIIIIIIIFAYGIAKALFQSNGFQFFKKNNLPSD